MGSLKNKQLLKRYLEGISTPEEKHIVDNWYQKLDEEPSVIIGDINKEKIRKEIWQNIQPAIATRPSVMKQLNYNWLKVAATILVIFTTGLLVWQNSYKDSVVNKANNSFTIISTKIGERKLVTLPDGTRLTLNSSSTVRINNDFSKKRNVGIVDGEVFFDVKHDTTRPFIIKSGALTTQVLGTAFNIRAYGDLKKLSVGVTRGKVGVQVAHLQVHFLVKGQQLVYDKHRLKTIISALNTSTLAWQQGNLVLNDASFEEMAVLINKQYGIQVITTNNKIQRKRFTATLNTSMPAVKAMEVIAAIHHFNTKQRRDTIEIYH